MDGISGHNRLFSVSEVIGVVYDSLVSGKSSEIFTFQNSVRRVIGSGDDVCRGENLGYVFHNRLFVRTDMGYAVGLGRRADGHQMPYELVALSMEKHNKETLEATVATNEHVLLYDDNGHLATNEDSVLGKKVMGALRPVILEHIINFTTRKHRIVPEREFTVRDFFHQSVVPMVAQHLENILRETKVCCNMKQ